MIEKCNVTPQSVHALDAKMCRVWKAKMLAIDPNTKEVMGQILTKAPIMHCYREACNEVFGTWFNGNKPSTYNDMPSYF